MVDPYPTTKDRYRIGYTVAGHTDAKVGTDPYGKPAMEFTHTGGIIAIANELRRMLSDDLRANLDVSYYLSHAPADEVRQQTPQRPQQAVEPTPSRTDLAEFGAWAAEKERQLWEAAPPQPEDFGIAESADTEVLTTSEPARQSAAEPAGSLFDIPAASQPEQAVVPQEPLLTLYDLFGFSEQERSQILPKRRNRRAPTRKPTIPLSMFDQPAPSEPQPDDHVVEQPVPPEQEEYDPEKLYASLNWEENPPINGFYQMMMELSSERRAELRQEAAERRGQQAAQAPRAAPHSARRPIPSRVLSAGRCSRTTGREHWRWMKTVVSAICATSMPCAPCSTR